MIVRSVMLIAGETSGDLLAGELTTHLRPLFRDQAFEPRFFGAGGAHMAEAGVDIVQEMTRHAVVGVGDVIRSLRTYRRIFGQLLETFVERRPELIVLVDFAGFNRRFARALRARCSRLKEGRGQWRPRIVQYVSPQVWASRPGRAYSMARDLDLLLCLFPFEKQWYAKRLPQLDVECVGHPICDRYPEQWEQIIDGRTGESDVEPLDGASPLLLLLPGSRKAELRRHLVVMIEAAYQVASRTRIRARVVVSTPQLEVQARQLMAEIVAKKEAEAGGDTAEERKWISAVPIQSGPLESSLRAAKLALASTGTVTLECALFGVPTVALYKTSWSTYQIAKRLVTVDYMAMPNILAGRELYPEFIQSDATPSALASALISLATEPERRHAVRQGLGEVVRQLGGPGASQRAAVRVSRLFEGT